LFVVFYRFFWRAFLFFFLKKLIVIFALKNFAAFILIKKRSLVFSVFSQKNIFLSFPLRTSGQGGDV